MMNLFRLAIASVLCVPMLAVIPSIASAQTHRESLAIPLPDARIEIYKAKRELVLYSGDQIVRRYRIGLGFTPNGQKFKEGDGATPEGTYMICVKNPKSRYYLSLGINYPNAHDAKRSFESGHITKSAFDKIIAAEVSGKCPPWDTPLGGEIYVHGHGSSSDWTLGCIALDNVHIKELFDATSIGTTVTLFP